MSSSPTAPTSTTASSTSSPSPADPHPLPLPDSSAVLSGISAERSLTNPGQRPLALIACGALAQPAAEVVARRGWPVEVHPLPPLLHNRPDRIAAEVDRLAARLLTRFDRVAVGYADCGTYGALDEVCDRRGLTRLAGLHCYDVYAGADRVESLFEAQPGTYVLTDFLVRSFERSVVVELGLDRYPQLREDYFGHYTRVVWLAQQPDAELTRLAKRAAERIGLPLTVVPTGLGGLERALATLVAGV